MGGLLDWLGGLSDWLGTAWDWIKSQFATLIEWLGYEWESLKEWFANFWGALKKALCWLKNLKLSTIWGWIKKAYGWIRKAIGYYKQYILKPMEDERQRIYLLYQTYFAPIVHVIDDVRKLMNIVAIFNRKLAAKIDQRLMALEGWVLLPITDLLKRVNQLSGWGRAIITDLGYLDRPLLLESMRRDVVDIWQVLTNPLQRNLAQAGTGSQPTTAVIVNNLQTYLQDGGGPYLDSTMNFQTYYQQATTQIGGL